MADLAPSRSALLAACVTLLALAGCTATPPLVTPTPAPARASSADRTAGGGSPTPASTAPASPSPAPTSGAASTGSPGAPGATGASTPSSLADVPGGTATAVPAPARPAPSPLPGSVEVTPDVRAFIDAAAVLAARGEAVTAASLAAASPQASALLASGNARVTGDALQIMATYDADLPAARAAIEAASGTVERTDASSRLVQASVPVGRLATLQSSTAITRIRLPEPGVR